MGPKGGNQMNILSSADLDWFQGEQFRHDALAHADIASLPMRRQLVNFILHLSKYQGRLIKALRSEDEESIQRLITDSFIILLATANALGKSPRIVGAGRPTSLSHLRTSEALMFAYVEVVGEMSKACEAFDDNENYPSHSMLDTCLGTLLRIVIALANVSNVPLLESVPHRWSRVERRALANRKAAPIADVA
ncbi:MAG TPA: hypothetical protein VHY19_02375 [Steroidobacteraceae bacterium]|nr:hypothetical protein [Steroidobacteraceae bacterium]